MLKLAYCVTALANKGPVIVIRDIVNNIADKCDVTIFYIDDIVEVEFPESVKLVKLNSVFQHYNFSDFDIVHSHLFRADLLCYRNRASIKSGSPHKLIDVKSRIFSYHKHRRFFMKTGFVA